MTDDVKKIAGTLTKRERLDIRRKASGKSICRTSGDSFFALNIVTSKERLTPLGLAVARELETQG